VLVYWLEQTYADVPGADHWLSPAEQVRLRGLRFAKRRNEWRLGRWTAKRAVASFLKLPQSSQAFSGICIRAADCGAPEVFLDDRLVLGPSALPAPAISLSHRAGAALCAVALPGVELGCDLETLEPREESFLQVYFTAEEQALVRQGPASDRARLLALLWSAKESALKMMRVGLRADTRSVAVTPREHLSAQEWHRLEVRSACGTLFQGWWRTRGCKVMTVVVNPAPDRPVRLPLFPSATLCPSEASSAEGL
jgi:4'-phosphopantetheinyl transferase